MTTAVAPEIKIEDETTHEVAFEFQDIPPLENGDRLTRAEFERRYDAMPHLKKAELIEGIVYMGSPVGHEGHGRPHFNMISWLGRYCDMTPGIGGGDNSSIRLDLDNMPQPDAFLYVLPEHGGRVQIDEDDYVAVSPEFVAEVASSSASYDMHAKRKVYRRNGVREYAVWLVRQRKVRWFMLREGRYEELPPGPDGIFRSEVLPGLWLDPKALMRDDRTAMVALAEQAKATPEHAAFVERLRAAYRPPTGSGTEPT